MEESSQRIIHASTRQKKNGRNNSQRESLAPPTAFLEPTAICRGRRRKAASPTAARKPSAPNNRRRYLSEPDGSRRRQSPVGVRAPSEYPPRASALNPATVFFHGKADSNAVGLTMVSSFVEDFDDLVLQFLVLQFLMLFIMM